MANHLEVARMYGVNKALAEAGYKSAAEVQAEAEAIGLVEKTAAPVAANPLDELFRSLKK